MKNLEHNNAPLLADHTVVGGGIAGLAAAIELAKLSSSVALIEPRIRPDLRSLFVRGDVLSRLPPHMVIDLNTAITGWQYHAAASNTNLNFKLPSPHNESEAYFMIDHKFIIDAMKKSFLGLGGTIVSEGAKGKIARVTDYPDKAIVQFSDGNLFQTGRVIDATGKQSSVLRNTFNSENLPVFNEGDPIVMWVFGRCFESGWPDNLDKTLFTPVTTNAGRVSWAAPYGDNRFDVVASDYCRLSDLTKPKHVQTMKQMFQNLLDICHSRGIHPKDKGKTIFGAVRLMPMKKNSSHNVMAVGEAAGYPSPFMAESITPALVHAPMTARMAVDGTAPATHLQHWKQKKPIFPYKAEAALLHRRLSNKTAGSNAPFYAQGTANLNEEEQRILLHDRKVGFSTLLKRAPALFLDKDFLFWSAKVGATLLTLLANDGQYTEKQAKQHLFPGIHYQIDNQE